MTLSDRTVGPAFALVLGLQLTSAMSCRRDDPAAAVVPPAESAEQSAEEPAPRAGSDLAAFRGQCVVLEGSTGGRKVGPELRTGDASVAIVFATPEGEAQWNDLPGGTRVRVQGDVSERADLPVFVPREGEPIRAGIPVPEGTDLEAARRRLVVEQAELTVLRPVGDVERDLLAQVGTTVALPGILWSTNGHWWFQHDGVDLHLEHREAIADWSEMHGRAVTLHGALTRKPMPRLDQILLKPEPDLADAFVLTLERAAPPPEPVIAACSSAPP